MSERRAGTQLSVYLDATERAKVKALAQQTGRSISGVVRELVRRAESPGRDLTLRPTDDAHDDAGG